VSSHKRKKTSGIARLDYDPSGSYALDIEVFTVADLRQRLGKRRLRLPHRYAFGMVLCVTRGECTQVIDFESVRCKPGSLLGIRPGQAHRFGDERDWDGWIVLYRPEAITQRMTAHLALREPEQRLVTGAIVQMKEDTRMTSPVAQLNALLRQLLSALLLRLSIFEGRGGKSDVTSKSAQRHGVFQQLVEGNFAKWHQVAHYANRMGCSEKSLTRAAMQSAGVTAKAVIASRINLEAKRMLVHSTMSVTLIAEQLGFDDPTNFVKFFRREAHCTPREFRQRHAEVDALG
jgi:AraC-like DNA-binding protein